GLTLANRPSREVWAATVISRAGKPSEAASFVPKRCYGLAPAVGDRGMFPMDRLGFCDAPTLPARYRSCCDAGRATDRAGGRHGPDAGVSRHGDYQGKWRQAFRIRA